MTAARPILVVDDDPGIREFICVALQEEGYPVRAAADGQAALRAVERELPALILLDLWMPRLDGQGFLQAYRRLPDAQAPVVIFAAATDQANPDAPTDVAAYLPKPVDLEELLSVVERLTHDP